MEICKLCEKPCKTKKTVFCSVQCSNAARIRQCVCEKCGALFDRTSQYRRRFCDDCFGSLRNTLGADSKGCLRSRAAGYQSFRSGIRRHAWRTYRNLNLSRSCFICGYSIYIEIAHIKPVSQFEDSATLAEINNPSNLVALCPNHHWEFDHNLFSLLSRSR